MAELWRDRVHPADFPVDLDNLSRQLPEDLVNEAIDHLTKIGWKIKNGKNANAHIVLSYADALQMPERNLRGLGELEQARAHFDFINYGLQEEL